MAKEKIALLEPDKEQREVFASWLKQEGYEVKSADNPEEVPPLLSREKPDILIIDVDSPRTTESLFQSCQALKKDPRFLEIPIAVLTYKKDAQKIASALEAGADNFVLKPFETDSFLKRIETIFKEIELKKQGKKVLDLDYINYLIKLTSEGNRKGFFLLSPVIFNKLIMDKAKAILGEPVLIVMIKRLQGLVGEDYKFMKAVRFSNAQIYLEEVDKASKGIPVDKLTIAFRDYVYEFLQLVRTLTSDILMERGKLETD